MRTNNAPRQQHATMKYAPTRTATRSGTRAQRPSTRTPRTTSVSFQPHSVLFDKGVIRRVYERRVRFARSAPPTPAQVEAANVYAQLCIPPRRLYIYSACGCGHGGTRNSKISRSIHTRSVSPAAIAGVRGCHRVAEPLLLVGSGHSKGWRKEA